MGLVHGVTEHVQTVFDTNHGRGALIYPNPSANFGSRKIGGFILYIRRKVAAGIAAALVAMSLSTMPVKANTQTGVVTANVLNLRQGPSISNNILGKLIKGESLEVIEHQGDWIKVKTKVGTEGWVSSTYVDVNAVTTGSKSGYVSASVLNFRSQPVIGNNVLNQLQNGTALTILSEQSGWYKVRTISGTEGWVSSEYVKLDNGSVTVSRGTMESRTQAQSESISQTSLNEALSSKIISYANGLLGTPYVWGGTSPKGFDCSGFVYYVFSAFDIKLNRVSRDQALQGTAVQKSELREGDLVFFDTNGTRQTINHVGIYIGSGKFIHASSGKSANAVVISDLNTGFYAQNYMRARRVIK